MTEFLLQKQPGRGTIYHRAPGIWFSGELKRWMVTSPELIRQAMHDRAFVAPSYDFSPFMKNMHVDLLHLDEIRRWFPIAEEGERHVILREKFARHISQRTAFALESLASELDTRRVALLSMGIKEEFCLYSLVLRPAMLQVVSSFANTRLPEEFAIEMIPQYFDDTISPMRRKKIIDVLNAIVSSFPSEWTPDQKYFNCAVIALSANTLPGSISLTILETLRMQPGRLLSQMDWSTDLLRTGLPLIEKNVAYDTVLGPVKLKKGERVRLFIESDGILPEQHARYSDLFFAVGSHKCVGMNASRQIWMKFAEFFLAIPRRMVLLNASERTGDYVFNFPQVIKVQFDV